MLYFLNLLLVAQISIHEVLYCLAGVNNSSVVEAPEMLANVLQ